MEKAMARGREQEQASFSCGTEGTDPRILEALEMEFSALEEEKEVRLLFAAESGSRAWGFASPDSDYDVRFVYVHEPEWYLRLEKRRDTIEWKLDETLDISGWDLAKFLRLMRASNPSVMEWLASPIVYREHSAFAGMQELGRASFQPRAGIYHYLHMAKGDYEKFCQAELVRPKKYFYAIRPILAARWILERRIAPPMRIEELAEAELEPALMPLVESLLEEKMQEGEHASRPRIDELSSWIGRSVEDISEKVEDIPKEEKLPWERYDEEFLHVIDEVHGIEQMRCARE